MDLALTEEQEMIKSFARDFLQRECPTSLVRAMEEDPVGYPRDLWSQMAQLGWMGLALPEEYGGAGSTFLDLCLLVEEQGRSLLPGPFFSTVVLGGLPIAEFGSDEQRAFYLPGIASGETVMAYAQTEPRVRLDSSGIVLRATAEGGDYLLSGTKVFVPYAHVADWFLVSTRTSGTGDEGVTLFLVDANSQGIVCQPLTTIASDHQSNVTFYNVRVPNSNVLGQVDNGWPIVQKINQWGASAKCAQMVGSAQQVLDMTVEYAKQRVQFGHPIGSFQAIQHYCADMVTDVDGSRFIAYEAIWRLSQGLEASMEVSVAKAWVSDALCRVCAMSHQIHGAIGFTKEHDLQLYTRRAKAAELAFGDGPYHRELVTRQLGL